MVKCLNVREYDASFNTHKHSLKCQNHKQFGRKQTFYVFACIFAP